MTDQASAEVNFIVSLHGRGLHQVCIAKGTLEDVTQRAEACLLAGFEVAVYSLKLNTTDGRPPYLPVGINPLQREFVMWDAVDEVHDLTNGIIMHMDEHTEGMARRYLQQAIDELTSALEKLEAVPTSNEPTFGQGESPTTGS